ncbi:MAG: protein kinase [Kiritimatiellae bacterium]|nr:protein kinase [Kiritimatiellia bacterium]
MTCGKWKLAHEIGRGAYGVVYRAVGSGGGCAAVRVCRRDAVGDECFERELRGAKLFKSVPPQEGLVRMRDLVETDWGFYTVLDLADDEFFGSSNSAQGYRPKTLARVIAGEKALPLKESIKLAISLANGLSALQRHHLLHRDIKPGNVIYVAGRPVLSDPGLLIEESDAVSLVGTPGYVPPEKFTDAASDIYSLGLTLKAASFGRQVDELDKGPAMEADTGSACFPAWWRILNKATDPVASRRYQSAKALVKELKMLRVRMLFAKSAWVSRVAVGCMLLAVVAYAYVSDRDRRRLSAEIEPLKNVMSAMDSLNDMSTQDDKVWSSFAGSYFCHTDETHLQRLKRVEERDAVRAARMRAILDDMQGIDRKGEENNRRIQSLRDKSKGVSGQNAAEYYNQAEMISMENEKLVKAWLSLLERFTAIEDAVKEQK